MTGAMGGANGQHPECYLAASGCAALVNFPLWKASAMAQSGFVFTGPQGQPLGPVQSFLRGVMPPYRGAPAVLAGMTWARAAIFYGSDAGRAMLQSAGVPDAVAFTVPPMVVSTCVQLINMPLVRASVSMQNPEVWSKPSMATTFRAIRHIYSTKGFAALWHGTSAGILKTVPKYVTSVVAKDMLEEVSGRACGIADAAVCVHAPHAYATRAVAPTSGYHRPGTRTRGRRCSHAQP